jgi:aspartyl protease family protein
MNAEMGPYLPLSALLLILLIGVLLARRAPMFRMLLSVATWGAVIGLTLLVVSQPGRVVPYLARFVATLKPDNQEVVGKEVRIRMSPDGHFWARARIAGVERRMLIDSGATVTALSTDTAAAAGLEVHDNMIPIVLNTANGKITAQTSTIEELRLGDITARDLDVVVGPALGGTDVVGMNFL